MRWLVEVIDIVATKKRLSDLLSHLEVTLHLEEDRAYLVSVRFELLETSTDVWLLAEKIHNDFFEVSSCIPDVNVNFKLGALYEQKDNGSRVGRNFSYATGITITRGITTGALPLNVAHITECQEPRDLFSHRLVAIHYDDRARKVHRFLQQDLAPLQMYYIYELIEDDLGKKISGLSSKKEFVRFKHSLNHPEVFRDASRHMVLEGDPPKNPMSLSEAQDFIAKVSDLWFAKLSERIKHPNI